MNNATDQRGFAHPVLAVFLLVAVLGTVGFSGYRVMNRNKTAEVQSAPVSSTQIVINTEAPAEAAEASTTPAPELTIKSQGSAAVSKPRSSGTPQNSNPAKPSTTPATSQSATTGTIKVTNQYDVATPIGSLSQLIVEAKQGDYGNALYFVTPDFINRAYSAIGVEDFSGFISSCDTNDACKMLASTKVSFDLSHITESDCTVPSGSAFTRCRRVTTKFMYTDNTLKTVYYKTVGYDVRSASITMLIGDGDTNWVIDKVSVDGWTL